MNKEQWMWMQASIALMATAAAAMALGGNAKPTAEETLVPPEH